MGCEQWSNEAATAQAHAVMRICSLINCTYLLRDTYKCVPPKVSGSSRSFQVVHAMLGTVFAVRFIVHD